MLFTPLAIKGTILRNRIVMPAMNTNFGEKDGSVSDRLIDYFVERGKGGTGLIISSPAYIDPSARKRARSLLLHEDSYIPKLIRFTQAVHQTGARIFLQLNHNGRLIKSSKEYKTAVTSGAVGPSAIPHLLTGDIPHALTIEEIKMLIEKFGQTARRAKEAGFDGVEIHGSHGYLIDEFFSVYSNRRIDEYGGSIENRMRFPLEIVHRVRELTGNDFLLSYRFNARDSAPVETPLSDVIQLCQRLEKAGIDLLHLSAGSSETPAMLLNTLPPGSAPRGCYADLSAAVKGKVGVPLIVVGRINTPETAENILKEGKADLVATGRALIADPYWPEKSLKGRSQTIRRCLGCSQGCQEQLVQEKEITCIYNPEVGRENERIQPAPKKKKVWVVGGGPGGMEAAVVARLRGHYVELYEKDNELGGQSLLAATPPGKEEFIAVRDFLASEIKRLKIAVFLHREIHPEQVAEGRPDAMIIATGASPLIPDLPGIRRDNVITAWDVLKGKTVADKIVVVGGGLVGIETGLFLSQKGKKVIVIEMLDKIALDAGLLNRARLEEELKKTDIEVRCNTVLVGIDGKGAIVRSRGMESLLPAETVVLALGASPLNHLFDTLKDKVPEIYAVGDCVKPRTILEAVREAYDVANKI